MGDKSAPVVVVPIEALQIYIMSVRLSGFERGWCHKILELGEM